MPSGASNSPIVKKGARRRGSDDGGRRKGDKTCHIKDKKL